MTKSSDNELHIRAEAYRLTLARASVDEAAQTAQVAINMDIDPQHPLYRPLHTGIVIAYGRAFTEMKPLGTISSKWSKFSDADEQRIHDILMKQRNQFVGHSDHIPNKVIIYPKGVVMYGGEIAPRAQTEVLSNYINPARFNQILTLATDLRDRMAEHVSEILEKLYGPEGINLKETLELISEADISELKKLHR